MRILIATDAFPPRCGGSGWSTFELARGLRGRGHDILVVQPRVGASVNEAREYDGFTVQEVPFAAPDVPFVRNYLKNERLYRRLAPILERLIVDRDVSLVHAQHVLTAPPSIAAARAAGVPVVATVRDYWPVCYWSDLTYDRRADQLCPGCSAAMMTRCVRPRAPRTWPLALPLIPYMRRNLALKRQALARADAVIAVSSAIERDLRERAPELAQTVVERIPNPVACDAIRAEADRGSAPITGPYAIYVGKLAPNKGTSKLIPAVSRARLPWPLVVVGDGPDRAAVEREARDSGHDVRFQGWLARDETLRYLRHAALVVFPSQGPESLSRVLLEASALGRAIAAMDTGGTQDIIISGRTGLLSSSAAAFAADIGRLVQDRDLAGRLGEGAARHVRETFDAPRVVERIEQVYNRLAGAAGSRRAAPRG